MFKKLLFNIAKAPFMSKFIGTAFRYFSWAIPIKKVYNSKDVIAFYHPKPSYENHIIISPKRAIENLQQMSTEGFENYFVQIWNVVKDIHATHPEYRDSFALVANGGKRQKVSQMHFHMFTNHDIVNADWEIHMEVPAVSESQITNVTFRTILQSIDLLDGESDIVKKGYSLIYQYNQRENDMDCPRFHIVSGKKLNHL